MSDSSDSTDGDDAQSTQAEQHDVVDIDELRGPVKESVKEAVREALSETKLELRPVDEDSQGSSDGSADSDDGSSLLSKGPGFLVTFVLLAIVVLALKEIGPFASDSSDETDPSLDVDFDEDDE